MGLGVRQTLERAKLRVPQDIAVVTFDALSWTAEGGPKFTAMRQPVDKVAASAVRLLLEKVRGRTEITHIELPVELIIGESTPKESTYGWDPDTKQITVRNCLALR